MFDPKIQIAAHFHHLIDFYAHFLGILSLHLLCHIVWIENLMCFKVHTLFIAPYDFKIETINNFEVWFALSRPRNVWNSVHHYFFWRFKNRRIHLSFIDLLEVFNISYLWWLGYALSMAKALPPIISDSLLGVGCKSAKYQIATNQCSSPALARVTMNNNHVFGIRYKVWLIFTYSWGIHASFGKLQIVHSKLESDDLPMERKLLQSQLLQIVLYRKSCQTYSRLGNSFHAYLSRSLLPKY